MHALRLIEPGRTEVVDLPEPAAPGEGEVRLAIRRIGLCGSDLNTFRGLNPMVSFPRIPGHEIGATVEALGRGVPEKWRVGQTVTVSPYTACGRCGSCQAGRVNACEYNETMGVQRDGALTAYINVPHEKLFAHADLSLDELALVEPFSVGFHAANRGRVAAGEHVLVLGSGTIGLGAIAGAAHKGARVIAVDLDARKLALAEALGAVATLDARQEDLDAKLKKLTDGLGPHVVIEAIGLPQTFRQAVEVVRYAGRVVYIGYAKAPVEYETKLFVAKELDIMGSRNALGEFQEVIDSFVARRFDPKKLITHRVSLPESGQALADWSTHPGPVTKIMVEVG